MTEVPTVVDDENTRTTDGSDGDPVLTMPEPGNRGNAAFDPRPYLRAMRGRGGTQDYLDVKWRLLWLRREHPDAEIVTEHVRIDETSAIFKATVALPTGGKATGYGSETAGDFGDFIEKAETKAIGRALNALGYGAQFADDTDEAAARLAPAPTVAERPATARPTRSAPPPAAPREPIAIDPERQRPGPAAPPPTAASASNRAATPNSAEPAATDEPDMADYTPTAFWRWAKEQGLDRPGVEQLIGRSVIGLTPLEMRRLVLDATDR